MKLAVFHSLPEALMYFLLILLLMLNIVGLAISSNNAQQAKMLAAQAKTLAAQNQVLAAANQTNTKLILESQQCIAQFFLIQNRTTLTIGALPGCQQVIKNLNIKP